MPDSTNSREGERRTLLRRRSTGFFNVPLDSSQPGLLAQAPQPSDTPDTTRSAIEPSAPRLTGLSISANSPQEGSPAPTSTATRPSAFNPALATPIATAPQVGTQPVEGVPDTFTPTGTTRPSPTAQATPRPSPSKHAFLDGFKYHGALHASYTSPQVKVAPQKRQQDTLYSSEQAAIVEAIEYILHAAKPGNGSAEMSLTIRGYDQLLVAFAKHYTDILKQQRGYRVDINVEPSQAPAPAPAPRNMPFGA